jgi:hypothetical protein
MQKGVYCSVSAKEKLALYGRQGENTVHIQHENGCLSLPWRTSHVSSARLTHFIFAIVFLAVYLVGKSKRGTGISSAQCGYLVVTLPVLYLGSAISDWDLSLLGIGGHRNPLFHSSMPFFVLMAIDRWTGLTALLPSLMSAVYISFALGLSSHLVLDVIQYGDVRWIPGGTLDRLWLTVNAMVLAIAAWFAASAPKSTPNP